MPANFRIRQLLVVLSGVVAALIGYGVIRLVDVDLILKNGDEVTVVEVLFAALVGGLLAWSVYEVLARTGYERWWPFIGSTALAISMLGPAYQADGSTAVALIALHLLVAIILIWGLAMTGASAQAREPRAAQPRRRTERQLPGA